MTDYSEDQVFSDSFTRADESPLADPWLNYPGVTGIYLKSNKIAPGGSGTGNWHSYYKHVQSADQSIQVTIAQLAGASAGQNFQLVLRGRNYGYASTRSYYVATLYANPSNNTFIVQKVVSGSVTTLSGGYVSHTWAANDVVILQIVGTTLSLIVNGSSIWSTTDSSVAGPGYADIGFNNESGGNDGNMRLDDVIITSIGGSVIESTTSVSATEERERLDSDTIGSVTSVSAVEDYSRTPTLDSDTIVSVTSYDGTEFMALWYADADTVPVVSSVEFVESDFGHAEADITVTVTTPSFEENYWPCPTGYWGSNEVPDVLAVTVAAVDASTIKTRTSLSGVEEYA